MHFKYSTCIITINEPVDYMGRAVMILIRGTFSPSPLESAVTTTAEGIVIVLGP